MMKRLTALALALALLLAATVACAESAISTVTLSELSFARIRDGKAKSAVNLKRMSLSFSVGCTENVPTLQATFDNGKGQLVDLIFQVADSRLLMSAGGVSGTYYIDLEALSDDPREGAKLARAIGDGLALGGGHLDALLQALTTEDANGVRRVEFVLPEEVYTAAATSALNIIGGLGFTKQSDEEKMRENLRDADERTSLIICYRQSKGDLEINAVRGGQGIQIKGKMALTMEDMPLVNISTDEMMCDLTNIGLGKLFELRGELAIIALKFGHFSGGTGLSRIFG